MADQSVGSSLRTFARARNCGDRLGANDHDDKGRHPSGCWQASRYNFHRTGSSFASSRVVRSSSSRRILKMLDAI